MSTKRQTRCEAGAQSYGPSHVGGGRATDKESLLRHPLPGPGSEVQRLPLLVQETVDGLMRCPAERKEAATREALSKLRPHIEAGLEELETLEGLVGLTDEELARQEAFIMLL